MRIAHVITRMIIGGAQENTLFNCQDLISDYGDEVLLITGPALGPEGDLLGQGRAHEVPIELIDSLRRPIHPWRDWVAARALKRVLRSFQPDVVHTHSAKGGLIGRAVAWSLGVPAVVHTIHGAPFHDYQNAAARRFFIGCERWAARRCHRMISVADAMTELMVNESVAPRSKFTTIYSGMDVEPFLAARENREKQRRELGLADEHVVIGKVARLFHLKGHEDLVRAAPSVVTAFPQVRFLLVGEGILREPLLQLMNDLGVRENFVLTGLVPPQQVPRLMGAMDALVHTSYREGLARALPQAFLSGIPAISYDVDGAKEVVLDGETGFLVSPADISQLAERLIQICCDFELRQAQGRAGRQKFTDQFRHQTMTRQIRDVYSELLR
ncbi:MAG: glycosyltransferase family 4 protein [Planctomycetota bacterium]